MLLLLLLLLLLLVARTYYSIIEFVHVTTVEDLKLQNSMSLDSILNQFNPVHIITPVLP
jgi:hypothetical protein